MNCLKFDKNKAVFMSKWFFFDESNQFKELGKDILNLFKKNCIININ